MPAYAIDTKTVRAMTREAEQVRARRMDQPAVEAIRYARAMAEIDCFRALMEESPGAWKK